ncbi:MAG: hypothetical protein Q8N53_03065 [Longimicrobiales bacterium]|nr:hypothetical protein [Longimicrobiales bacterium]
MNLDMLAGTPPWDWPEDAGEQILEALQDPGVSETDRLLATELAGNQVVLDDVLAEALLRILTDPGEPEALRARAAISLGPALEEAFLEGFEDPEITSITEPLFRRARDTLQALFHDPELPEEVRRRVLEASIRADAPWHEGAVRAAFHSGDPAWRLTAVFCMAFVPGFEKEIVEAMKSEDPDLLCEAIRSAGERAVDGAWPRIRAVILEATSGWALPRRGVEDTDRALLLEAIAAAAVIRPLEAAEILGDLTYSDDEDIAEAALDALASADELYQDDDLDDEEPASGNPTFH